MALRLPRHASSWRAARAERDAGAAEAAAARARPVRLPAAAAAAAPFNSGFALAPPLGRHRGSRCQEDVEAAAEAAAAPAAAALVALVPALLRAGRLRAPRSAAPAAGAAAREAARLQRRPGEGHCLQRPRRQLLRLRAGFLQPSAPHVSSAGCFAPLRSPRGSTGAGTALGSAPVAWGTARTDIQPAAQQKILRLCLR